MMTLALRNCRVLTRNRLCEGLAVVVRDGQIEDICPEDQLPTDDLEVRDLGGMLLLPGFIDVQVSAPEIPVQAGWRLFRAQALRKDAA